MQARAVRGGCLFVLLLLALPAISSSQAPIPPLPAVRREIRVGVPAVPASLDPALATDPAAALIARQVFDTLVGYREGTTEIEPALAARWTVSRDGLLWSFTLRENVRFHDGTLLTAAEVVASFERHWRPEIQGPVWRDLLRGMPGVVSGVRAPDSRTVQFALLQPYAPLLTVLAHPAFGIARPRADGARLVGTGPYRVVDASPGRLALEAAPGFWTTLPRASRLVFLEIVDDDQAERELDGRALDVWFPAGPPRRPEGALSVTGLRVGYLALQTEREPFSRRAFRHAVAAALDPAVIGVAVGRAAIPLQSFLPPGVWARREGSPILGGSRDTVRRLLREGGWQAGQPLTLLVPQEAGPLDMAKLAEAIQLMLASDRVEVRIQAEPESAVRTLLQSGAFELALVEATVAGGDPHLLLFPLSASEGAVKGPRAVNFSYFRDSRLDDVLIRASQLGFRPERRRLYVKAQGLLADELPWIPVYVRLHWAVVRPEVRGLRLHPTGFHRLDTLEVEGGLAP